MRRRQTKLDRFGRVLLPKGVRNTLGVEAGAVLEIEASYDRVVLRPQRQRPDLVREGGVLVYNGEADPEQLEETLEKLRDERLTHLGGRASE